MRTTRAAELSAAVVLIAAATVGTTTFSDAAYTSTTASGVSTVTAAADWTPPRVTLMAPASPLTGTVEIEASATDPEGSPTTIGIAVSPAGTDTWWEICDAIPSPASCSWDTTTVEDGVYDIRATATDTSGNAAEETVSGVIVDNTPDL